MESSKKKSLLVIGPGRVGMTFGRMISRLGVFHISQLLGRDAERTKSAADFVGTGEAISEFKKIVSPDVVLISTPDDEIISTVKSLSASVNLKAGTIVFHCSGMLSSEILREFLPLGCHVASLHPVRSFADAERAAASFQGTYCVMEGDREALDFLERLVEQLGGIGVILETGNKPLYHAGVVFASNYIVAMLDAATNCVASSGIERKLALGMLSSIAAGVVENVRIDDTADALTGPLKRGDVSTIKAHLEALKSMGKIYPILYKICGAELVELLDKNSSDSTVITSAQSRIQEIFSVDE